MDILIITIGLALTGILGFTAFAFMHESPAKSMRPKVSNLPPKDKPSEPDVIASYQRKLIAREEQIKNHEAAFAALQLELAQTKEREKTLLKEKSQIAFNEEEYEKFKKVYKSLKDELIKKEELLEKEIDSRRKQETELTQALKDIETYKNKSITSDDAFRKSETVAANLTKELKETKKMINEQNKIVEEHSENKIGGEWVSRDEFKKLENELKEKESLIQKLLALKARNA